MEHLGLQRMSLSNPSSPGSGSPAEEEVKEFSVRAREDGGHQENKIIQISRISAHKKCTEMRQHTQGLHSSAADKFPELKREVKTSPYP